MRKKTSFRKKLYQSAKFFFYLLGLSKKADEYFQVEVFANSLGKLHFIQDGATTEEKRDFFINQLSDLEIETHSFCNRACDFCPNAQFPRFDKQQVMPEGIFRKVIDELKMLGFRRTIQLNRYNEPLALDLIFERVKYARRQLACANIGFHSNGDFVTREKLDRLEEAGLDFIAISRYIDFSESRQQQLAAAQAHCEEYIQKLGLEAKRIVDEGSLARYLVMMRRMKVLVFVGDAERVWVDRGGSLKGYAGKIRISPCYNPFRKIFIDFSGDVLPCCNMRADLELHKPYVLGNVEKQTLQDIFYSQAANKIRRYLATFGAKDGVCKTCQFGVFAYSRRAEVCVNNALKKCGVG